MLAIKVVGSGCPSCQKLAALCQEIVDENKLEAEIEKVTEMEKFAELGIMITPGLLLNEVIVASGKIPAKSTLLRWIQDAASQA